mgnify:CR=1 FL=1
MRIGLSVLCFVAAAVSAVAAALVVQLWEVRGGDYGAKNDAIGFLLIAAPTFLVIGLLTILRAWWVFRPRLIVPAVGFSAFGAGIVANNYVMSERSLFCGVGAGLIAWWAAWRFDRRPKP